jgi:hypothetical protein
MLNFWQSLQHYLESSFNLEPGPAATIIISLFVFFIGFLIRGIINWLGRFKERRIVRRLFIDILKGLRDQIKKQRDGFKETSTSLDMKANTPWVINKATFFQIPVFKELKYSDTFKAFFLGLENSFVFLRGKSFILKKRQLFNKVWENNSNLDFWSEKIFTDFNKYLDKYNIYLDRWNNAVTELRLTWVKLHF